MDINQVLTKLRAELLDLPEETEDSLLDWVNQAIHDAEENHNYRHMEAEVAAVTVDATRLLVAKPDQWKEAGEPPYYVAQDGSVTEIQWSASASDMRRQYATNAEGSPEFVLETITQLQVYPLSDGQSDYVGGQYAVTVPYLAYSLPLDPDIPGQTTNFWTQKNPWYVIYKAAAYGFMSNYDTDKAAERGTMAQGLLTAAKRKDKRARIPRRVTMGVSRRVFGPGKRGRGFWRRGL